MNISNKIRDIESKVAKIHGEELRYLIVIANDLDAARRATEAHYPPGTTVLYLPANGRDPDGPGWYGPQGRVPTPTGFIDVSFPSFLKGQI